MLGLCTHIHLFLCLVITIITSHAHECPPGTMFCGDPTNNATWTCCGEGETCGIDSYGRPNMVGQCCPVDEGSVCFSNPTTVQCYSPKKNSCCSAKNLGISYQFLCVANATCCYANYGAASTCGVGSCCSGYATGMICPANSSGCCVNSNSPIGGSPLCYDYTKFSCCLYGFGNSLCSRNQYCDYQGGCKTMCPQNTIFCPNWNRNETNCCEENSETCSNGFCCPNQKPAACAQARGNSPPICFDSNRSTCCLLNNEKDFFVCDKNTQKCDPNIGCVSKM